MPRVRHYSEFERFEQIIRAHPAQLAREYISLTKEYVAKGTGEFSDTDTMMRYRDVIFALGMFQHTTAFPRELDERGFTVTIDGDLISKNGEF